MTSIDIELVAHDGHDVTEYRISNRTTLIQLGASVDATYGHPATPEPRLIRDLSPDQAAQYLVSRFAGDCIFFLIRDGSAGIVIRPPFSEIPVFYTMPSESRREMTCIWTSLSLPNAMAAHLNNVDWGYLNSTLLNPTIVSPRTGFKNVRELLSGAILDLRGDLPEQRDCLAWLIPRVSPVSHADGFDSVVDRFRSTLLASVAHKVRGHESSTGVAASGGLDSSVIAIAASRCLPEHHIPLVNSYRGDDSSSDERTYLAALAETLPNAISRTVESSAGQPQSDLSPSLLAPTARPCKIAMVAPVNAQLRSELELLGCDRVLSGDGGDQLYLRVSRLVLLRELIDEARSPASKVRALVDTAAYQHQSLWSALRTLRHPPRSAQHWRNMFGDAAFPVSRLTPQPSALVDVVPGAAEARSWPLSIAFQYVALRSAEMNRIALTGSSVSERKPTLFWPLVQLGLGTPRNVHIHQGVDRAIERALFPELPPEILHRIGKGGGRDLPTRFDYAAIAARLADSSLAKRGHLSQARLRELVDAGTVSDVEEHLILLRGTAITDWMEKNIGTEK